MKIAAAFFLLLATLSAVNAQTWTEFEKIRPNSQPSAFLFFSPDNKQLIVGARTRWLPRADGPVKLANNVTTVLDVALGTVPKRLGKFGEVLVAESFLPSGRLAIVYDDDRGRQYCAELDPATWTVASRRTLFTPEGLALGGRFGVFNADGSLFATHYGHIEGEVVPPLRFVGRTDVWKTADWSRVATFDRPHGADSPNMRFAAPTLLADSPREYPDRQDDVRYSNIDFNSRLMMPMYATEPEPTLRGTIDMWGPQQAIDFTPDGRYMVAGLVNNVAGSLLLYNIDYGLQSEPRYRALDPNPRTRRERIYTAIAFSPDGRWMAAGIIDGTIKIWDTSNWQPVQEMPANMREVMALAFSPDKSMLAASFRDGNVQLWKFKP